MFEVNTKVRSELGAEGVVEQVERGKNGELLVYIRWKTGALGTYTEEEVRRYKISKVS